MTENNIKQQTDKQQAEDIWLNVRSNPASELLETEAYGNPPQPGRPDGCSTGPDLL